MRVDILKICEIAKEAGFAIMDIYDKDHNIEYKKDASPLTKADKASHDIIISRLKGLYPDIPVISEEGRDIPFTERKEWKFFWLIDPLDGTKEFIKKNGEFTVNISLISKNTPVLGVIYIPVEKVVYYAQKENGAWKYSSNTRPVQIYVKRSNRKAGLDMVTSRSHLTKETQEFVDKLDINETILMGSSWKFCLIAEGRADIYPRYGPTWEWDTAAGHCIVVEAGGEIVDFSNKPITYNKENLLHNNFLVCSSLNQVNLHV